MNGKTCSNFKFLSWGKCVKLFKSFSKRMENKIIFPTWLDPFCLIVQLFFCFSWIVSQTFDTAVMKMTWCWGSVHPPYTNNRGWQWEQKHGGKSSYTSWKKMFRQKCTETKRSAERLYCSCNITSSKLRCNCCYIYHCYHYGLVFKWSLQYKWM